MSAFLSVNGSRAVSGRVTVPYYGPIVADIVMASPDITTDALTIVVGDLTIKATARRVGSFSGARSVRAVGGAGGWRKTIPARSYSHPSAGVRLSTVLRDAATECGESIVVASDRSVGAAWVRDRAKAEATIRRLTSGAWWVDTAGVTQTKARDGSKIVTPFTVVEWSGAKGRFQIATENYRDWMPGRTFSAPTVTATQTVSSVSLTAENDGKLRLDVLTADAERDRLLADMRKIVRSEMGSLVFFGHWEYTVVSGDNSAVDVKPLDPQGPVPSLTKVPMLPSVLGETVTPAPGSACVIVFLNGDPSKPRCISIDGPPLEASVDATLLKLGQGALPVARGTDMAGPFPIVPTQVTVLA